MARRGRPPIRRHCRPNFTPAQVRRERAKGFWHPAFQTSICRYVCVRPLKVAKFVPTVPNTDGEFAILHPSTKTKGAWQLSLFDKQGPWGDRERDTCSEAAQELAHIYSRWRVVDWVDRE